MPYNLPGGAYSEYRSFLKNKAKRLLIPYVAVAFLWVLPISRYFFRWSAIELVKKYVLCCNPSQLWFLWMLFDVFALSWPLWNILQKFRYGAITVLIFYGIGIVGSELLINIFCIWTAFQYMIFFFIGIQLRRCHVAGKKILIEQIPWWITMFIDLGIFALYMAAAHMNGIIGRTIRTGVLFALHVIGALMAFVILQKVGARINWEDKNPFMVMARNVMTIYLLHQQIIYIIIYWGNGKINPYINVGFNFVLALLGSLSISLLLRTFKMTRWLIGEGS